MWPYIDVSWGCKTSLSTQYLCVELSDSWLKLFPLLAFPLHQDNPLVYWGWRNLFVQMELFLVVMIPRSNCHCCSLNKGFWMHFAGVIILGGGWIAERCELLIGHSYLFSAHCLGLGLLRTFTSVFFRCGLYCHLRDSEWRFHFSRLPLSGRSFNSGSPMCFLTCLLLTSSRASPSAAPVIWQNLSLWSDGSSSVLRTWGLILGHFFPTRVRDNLQLSQVPSIFTQRNVACLSWSSSRSVEDVFPNLPGDWAAGQLVPSCSFLLVDNHMSDC